MDTVELRLNPTREDCMHKQVARGLPYAHSRVVAERMAVAVHMRTFEFTHRFEAEWKPSGVNPVTGKVWCGDDRATEFR